MGGWDWIGALKLVCTYCLMFELAEHILVGDSTSPHALNKCNHSCTNINIKLKYNLTACLHFVCITFYFGIFSFAISVFMFFYYVFISCLLLCILSISDCVQFSSVIIRWYENGNNLTFWQI